MTDDQIKHMVERFLGWRLPEDFHPDDGISFKPTFNDHLDPPMRHRPTGTNLLDYTQAKAMVRHMVYGLCDSSASGVTMFHGLDTPEMVCFYEQEFYVLSNFSSFNIAWEGSTFQTAEHLYHWLKFAPDDSDVISGSPDLAASIKDAPSAHAAFKIAEMNRGYRRPDWDDVKVDFMREILRAKVAQHEYVHRKLLATGDRQLVENSWRDDFWGWGPNRDGQNMLGRLWMQVRDELRASSAP